MPEPDIGDPPQSGGSSDDSPEATAAADPFQTGATRRLRFASVEVDLPNTNPVVVLSEVDIPHRQLRITIGPAEGVAIAYAAKEIPTPKPLTHELFTSALEQYGLSVEVVRITAVAGTSFSGEIVLSGPRGPKVLECRPSDAIALALRQRVEVPIMASDQVMNEAGTPSP